MAKISLRAYNREIETLIDQGHYDEALAHGRYILKSYPKCLDTYRMMGKAYLEAHRYSEAQDLFRRLLLAVPDDFIGNLGMSIIYDEQKGLNNAIWHMERAFEVQPSNTAVQGELRRLYGRRDGLEPPQIRLTRGALAQMYARGSQVQQAIAEIRSILTEDPDRLDMQVLLARVYFRGGQKVEASDVCTGLLKKYPYCLDANRVMVEVLADASRSDSTQIYRHRVNALDPYSQFAPGSLFEAADVPDNAVTLEKLDIDQMEPLGEAGAEFGNLPQTALSLSLGAESEPGFSTPALPSGEAEAPQAAPAEEIPDWLKAAGWGAATAEAVRRAEMQADEENVKPEPPDSVAEELAAAEMPDWLKTMAPPEAAETAKTAEPLETAEADMDWLAGLGGPSAEEPESGTTHVGAGLTAAAVAAAAMAKKDGAEDEDAEQTQAEQMPEEMPDWMKDTSVPSTAPTPISESSPGGTSGPLPDWMADLSNQPSGPPPGMGAAVAGIAMAAGRDEGEPTPVEKAEVPAALESTEDVSTWLAGLDQGEQAGTAGGEAMADSPEEMNEDEAFAWLESLAAKQGANPDELLTEPGERPETPPEGLIQAEPTPAPAEEALSFEMPDGEQPAAVPDPTAAQMSEDDAFAWLESLAAKQGANPEELLTKPEERSETTPEWLAQPEPETPSMMDTLVGAASAAAVGAALSRDDELEEQVPPPGMDEAHAEPTLPAEAGPGESEPQQAAQAESQQEAVAQEATEDLSWLEGIEQETTSEELGAEMPPVSAWVPAEPLAQVTEPVQQMMEEESPAVPGPAPEAGTEAVREPAAELEEMPDWLRASLEETPEPPQGEGMPEWMATAAVLKAMTPDEEQEPEPEREAAPEPEPVVVAVPEPAAELSSPGIEVARPTPPEGDQGIFEQAQVDLQRGSLEEAAAGYSKLIKRGKMLDEVIYDLREGTYRHPVDVIIWMTLGDAYKRANRLQEALDAYTKGEELLR